MGRQVNSTLIAVKLILQALSSVPQSAVTLRDLTGFHRLSIRRYLVFLHSDYPANLIYISSYRRHAVTGPWTEYYSFGPGMQDVPKPKPVNSTRRSREYAARAKVLSTTALSILAPTSINQPKDIEL